MLNTQILRDYKVLDYIIRDLKVVYNMKMIPCSILKKIDITFTTDLWICQFAGRYGHVFTDHNSHAISCEGITLRGSNILLWQSIYSTEIVMMDEAFSK